MGLDEERYVREVVPVLEADDDAWDDLVVRYGLEDDPDAVPDQLHLMKVTAVWVQQLGAESPKRRERAVAFRATTVPADDPTFWASAWSDHRRRTGEPEPVPPPAAAPPSEPAPPAPPVAAPPVAAPPAAGPAVTPASDAFAEARLALDGGAPNEARRVLSSIRVALSEAEERQAAQLRAEVDERSREVDALVDRATGLLAPASGVPTAADQELAGELLARAVELDRHDERARQALARVPTPAPTAVTARVVGDTVLLSWSPAPYRFGTVSFLVLRAPADQGRLSRLTAAAVGTTDGSELTDAAEVGQELRYGVVALRAGGQDSEVVEAVEPVMVLAEVLDLRLQYDGVVVRGAWRRPDHCHRVEVVRTLVGEDGEGEELREGVRADGFTDADEVVGDRLYTVRCTYLVGGREVRSDGRAMAVSSQDAPDPVVDTEGSPEADRYVLTWSTPASGEVVLRVLDQEPTVAVGDRMGLAELTSLGEAVNAPVEVDGERSRVVLQGATRLAWYLPITTNGGAAVAGQAVLVDHLLPVEGLDARRRGDVAVATWIWPDQATDARVVATYQGTTTFNRTVSRAEVDREGGVHIPAGPEALHIRVIAVGSAARGRRQSAAVTVVVPPRPPTVYCEPTKRGGQTVLRLQSDRDCRILRLTVMGQRRQAPGSVHEGDEIAVLDDIDLLVGEVRHEPIGKVRRGVELAYFVGPHDAVFVRPGSPGPTSPVLP